MCFYYFSGRFNENDLHEFIDECFIICLSQMNQDKPLERRIAGLYLLYSMYVKQPLNEQRTQQLDIKIRMTQDDLFNARQLYSDCHNAGLKNICFFWFKLLSIGAIHFVFANRQNYGPSYIVNSRLISNRQTQVKQLVKQLDSEVKQKIEKIKNIHIVNDEMKEAMKEADSEIHIPRITNNSYLDESILETIKLQQKYSEVIINRQFKKRTNIKKEKKVEKTNEEYTQVHHVMPSLMVDELRGKISERKKRREKLKQSKQN